MLRLTAILISLRVMFSEIECSTDFQCESIIGVGSECKERKVGPDCEKKNMCTDPNKTKDYQSCECTHDYNGMCTNEPRDIPGDRCTFVATDVCPKHPTNDVWHCCINFLIFD